MGRRKIMDNDNAIVKIMKKIYKRIKFDFDYRGLHVLKENEGNCFIYEAIIHGGPCMIGRGGAVELRCVQEYLNSGSFSSAIKDEVQVCAGVFPPSDEILAKFSKYYIECMEKADLLALWSVGAEKKIVKEKCFHTQFTYLKALEPYYYDEPWSRALEGKRVLVIHPFSESIKIQYQKRKSLFKNQAVLPEFRELICIKAVQSNAGAIPEYTDWFVALEYMKNEIRKSDFDVAIIGAGAYSLPLAAYVKELGKVAVQMSGSTQILFGIKGRRWENIPEISCMFNENWIRPSEQETPKDCAKVEGGSYW